MTEQAAVSTPSTTTPTPAKKKVRQEIADKITGALAEYKQELGEKKLAIHVKKVSKLISRDLLKISKKQKQSKKATTKKAAPKAASKKTVKK